MMVLRLGNSAVWTVHKRNRIDINLLSNKSCWHDTVFYHTLWLTHLADRGPVNSRPHKIITEWNKITYPQSNINCSERSNRWHVMVPYKLSLPRCMQCRRGLAMRILSVCLSVRPSVFHTRVLWRNGRKICPDLYTIRKII